MSTDGLRDHDYTPIIKPLETLAGYGVDRSQVFDDFLTVVLGGLTRDPSDLPPVYGRYNRLASDPDVDPATHFQQMFRALLETYNEVNHDVIGAVCEELELQDEYNGQYFTPDDVTKLTAELLGATPAAEEEETTSDGVVRLTDYNGSDGVTVGATSDPETVHDPCCGTGRMLVESALDAPDDADRVYTGVDSSPLAAKMATINLGILNVPGHIWHGDSLSLEMHQHWAIQPTPFQLGYVTSV